MSVAGPGVKRLTPSRTDAVPSLCGPKMMPACPALVNTCVGKLRCLGCNREHCSIAAAILGCRITRLPAGCFGCDCDVMDFRLVADRAAGMPPDTAGKMPAATRPEAVRECALSRRSGSGIQLFADDLRELVRPEWFGEKIDAFLQWKIPANDIDAVAAGVNHFQF